MDVKKIDQELNVGDMVTFGRYVQMFEEISPVKWRVLDRTGERILLLSDRALETRCYRIYRANIMEINLDDLKKELVWSASDLRRWLNCYFFNSCFNELEKNMIVPVKHVSGFGEETDDRIFLLSKDEVERYFPDEDDRLTGITMHVIKEKFSDENDLGKLAELTKKMVKDWWLRTSGEYGAHYVSGSNGAVLCGIESEYSLVRPALWIGK